MALADFKLVVSDDRLQLALFISVIGIALYTEIKSWHSILRPQYAQVARLFSRTKSTMDDYRSAKYYKPWKSSTQTVVVSSKKHIAELSEAAGLSQRAVYADVNCPAHLILLGYADYTQMFGFKHNMNKYEHNTDDHKLVRTRLFSRVLQVNGPAHLQALYPHLISRLNEGLLEDFGDRAHESRLLWQDTVYEKPRNFVMEHKLLTMKASSPEFADALLRYPQDMVRCMGAFQITPGFMSPLIHAILTNRGKAMHLIQGQLRDCMSSGRSAWNEEEQIKSLTIMHNMTALTEDNDYWDPELLSQSLLGIWFAASHQPWMNLNFVILELCARKDWQTALREELKQHLPLDYKVLEQLPLLNGFIKETVRLNPLDTLAIRRKALRPYTFSDNSIFVPQNATVCVSAYNHMHDPKTYPEPDSFIPTRFSPDSSVQQHKFTDVSETFPVWGYGSLACPGRFHASLIIKMILSQLLLKYEFKLQDEKARTRWSWETFTMPYESTRVVFTKCES